MIFHGEKRFQYTSCPLFIPESGKGRAAMAGIHTLGSGGASAFWLGYLGSVCFSDGDHPKRSGGSLQGSADTSRTVLLFSVVRKSHSWGVISEGALSSGALFPSCLLNMAQAGGPGSEPLCPGNGQACAHNGPLVIPSPALCLRSSL